MARKCKTPTLVKELAQSQVNYLNWVDECIRVKTTVPAENQADHIREKSADYYIGLADGMNNMLEVAMMRSNCYAGFQYVGLEKTLEETKYNPVVGPDHPEYAGWRRHYSIRG